MEVKQLYGSSEFLRAGTEKMLQSGDSKLVAEEFLGQLLRKERGVASMVSARRMMTVTKGEVCHSAHS